MYLPFLQVYGTFPNYCLYGIITYFSSVTSMFIKINYYHTLDALFGEFVFISHDYNYLGNSHISVCCPYLNVSYYQSENEYSIDCKTGP